MKTALVCGAGGFIGSHLMRHLHEEEYKVIGVDIKYPAFCDVVACADGFLIKDLRKISSWAYLFDTFHIDEIYQLAADMGGAGYIFTGDHDAQVMMNSGLINLNLCRVLSTYTELIDGLTVFYSSSACIYPAGNQVAEDRPITAEHTAYPANPDSEYGWEKLFSERLYFAMARNLGLNVRVARFHNVFGPYGSYNNGKEKAPAALCRKIAELPPEGGTIEIWGDGNQTRSFLYIDEALEAVRRFVRSDFAGPLNIGSEEMVSINELVSMIAMISRKNVVVEHVPGPIGVRGRNSDNRLIREKLGWEPTRPLLAGLRETYSWIEEQIHGAKIKKDRTDS